MPRQNASTATHLLPASMGTASLLSDHGGAGLSSPELISSVPSRVASHKEAAIASLEKSAPKLSASLMPRLSSARQSVAQKSLTDFEVSSSLNPND